MKGRECPPKVARAFKVAGAFKGASFSLWKSSSVLGVQSKEFSHPLVAS